MIDIFLPYATMVEEAMRSVVRDALARTAEDGLVPPHHFYITFKTTYPGVVLSDAVVARHPDDITIVLQNKFHGLDVTEDDFSVVLGFSGIEERLVVPFAAITSFADPGAQFGLQFNVEEEGGGDEASPFQVTNADGDQTDTPSIPIAADQDNQDGQDETDEDPARPSGPAEVIALDSFRKK